MDDARRYSFAELACGACRIYPLVIAAGDVQCSMDAKPPAYGQESIVFIPANKALRLPLVVKRGGDEWRIGVYDIDVERDVRHGGWLCHIATKVWGTKDLIKSLKDAADDLYQRSFISVEEYCRIVGDYVLALSRANGESGGEEMKLRMKLVVDRKEFEAIKKGRKRFVRMPLAVFTAALPKNDDGTETGFCEIAFRARFTNDDFSLVRRVTKIVTGSTGVVGDYVGPIVRIHFAELER